MSDKPSGDGAAHPRVEVQLPGGRTVPGRIHAWRQDADGTWHAQVTLEVPAGAIQRVAGEDYTSVPRLPPPTRYVLEVDKRAPNRGSTIHDVTADCWALREVGNWARITPLKDADMARGMLKMPGTTACTVCAPEP